MPARPHRLAILALIGLLAVPAWARAGDDDPPDRHCVEAEEARAHTAGGDEGLPTFTRAFYRRRFTLDASLDGLDGKQLPLSIEEVCDVPAALASQAAQLAGTDGIALVSARTRVWLGDARVLGTAALTALDGADTATLRVRLVRQYRWREDEDGDPIPTFRARRITITD